MIAYVFPGQGSQIKGMGETLFESFPKETRIADEILGYSIAELCVENRDNQLNQTQYTQPALFVVNALSYLKELQRYGETPDYLAGHSLGEYNALFASGAIDFEMGVKLVKKRGQLMSQAKNGGMAAVIGLSEDKVKDILIARNFDAIDIANYNCPSQTVISGLLADIEKAKPVFMEHGAKLFVPLKVSAAFHSRYMEDTKREFREYLSGFKFSKMDIAVISNAYAEPYRDGDIAHNLVEQIAQPVRWTESIRYLMQQGAMTFKEIGPGTVLTKLIDKIKEETPVREKSASEQNQPSETETARKERLPASVRGESFGVSATSLGSAEFRKDYNVQYAYAAGAMFRGVASKELVVRMGKAGFLSHYGTGGLSTEQIEKGIVHIQTELSGGEPYGMNFLHYPEMPDKEEKLIDLYLKYGVRNVEASAFLQITPALVRYRANGLSPNESGTVDIKNKIIAKVSRPEIASAFLSPAPERIVNKLRALNRITQEQADLLKRVPMADDLCVEADSAGHTDQGVAYTLMPAMLRLRDEMMKNFNYPKRVRVGAAGGIGTPDAAAAAFVLGADFIVTGSINQCTVEAGTSDSVKDLLEQMNVQDTEYAPAGDMFELGARVQVLKKGVFFPARANSLYDLYRHHNSLDEIDEQTKKRLQEKYFRRSFDEIYDDVKEYFLKADPRQIEKAERNPKHKMALIFRWYFHYSIEVALAGDETRKVDYQIHCGPALGAFNQWVKGTELEKWKNRHVDEIAEKLIKETAELLRRRFDGFTKG